MMSSLKKPVSFSTSCFKNELGLPEPERKAPGGYMTYIEDYKSPLYLQILMAPVAMLMF